MKTNSEKLITSIPLVLMLKSIINQSIIEFICSRFTVVFACIFIFVTVFVSGCGGPGAASEPIQVRLSFSESPTLNKPVQLTANYSIHPSYKHDAHNVTAKIILPEGFEKVSGDLEWQGDIIQGAPLSLNATVKSIKTGDWDISATSLFYVYQQGYGGVTHIYVTVYNDYSAVYDRPPDHFTPSVVYSLPSTFGSPTSKP
jgi:hypothetical protein